MDVVSYENPCNNHHELIILLLLPIMFVVGGVPPDIERIALDNC